MSALTRERRELVLVTQRIARRQAELERDIALRNDLIVQLADAGGMSEREIGALAGLSGGRVHTIKVETRRGA